MPTRRIRARGGAVRVRRKKLKGGGYITVYVVRTPGPRGGRTVAHVHKKTRKRTTKRRATRRRSK